MKRSDFSVDLSGGQEVEPDCAESLLSHVESCIEIMPWPEPGQDLKQALEIAPEGVRLLYLIGQIQGPADNGGLGQYFALELPDWLHAMAKSAIASIGCPQMISIIEEAERYFAQHRDKLRDAETWDDFHAVVGIRAMDDALDNITSRYLEASEELNAARIRYVESHRDQFC